MVSSLRTGHWLPSYSPAREWLAATRSLRSGARGGVPRSSRRLASRLTDGPADDLLGLLDDLPQMLRPLEALRIELVDILRPRWPGREPAAVRHHLQPAE